MACRNVSDHTNADSSVQINADQCFGHEGCVKKKMFAGHILNNAHLFTYVSLMKIPHYQ